MCSRSIGTLLALVSLVAVVVAAGVGSPAVAADGSAGVSGDVGASTHTPGTTHTPDTTATREPAATTMRLQLQADGDARWRVTATYEFRDNADAAAFEDLAAAFEDGEVAFALDTLGLARRNASAATGREMTFRNVERTASRNDTAGEGTLTLAVTWTNFARVDDNSLYVGDAFNTTDGTWLPRLTERQTLVVEPPEGYSVVSAPQVGIVDGTARWEGPRRFDGREPWIVYAGQGSATTTTTTTAPPTTTTAPPPTTSPPGPGDLSSLVPVALLVLAAGASAAVLAVYMRREGRPGSGATAGSDDGGDGGATGEAGPGADETGRTGPDEHPADTAADTDATEVSDGSAAGNAGATADDGVDEALLSDEERVERLLERNGGRMKQANIVKETGWSNAKVSQLLSSMAEEGRIDKLRIGRENLISFPDEDVADFAGDDED